MDKKKIERRKVTARGFLAAFFVAVFLALPSFAVSELSNDEIVRFIQSGAPAVSVGLVGSRFYGTVYGTTQPFDFNYDSTVTSWINTNEVKSVNLDFHVGSVSDTIYKANYTYLVTVSLSQTYNRTGWTYGTAVGDYITDVEGVILYSSAKIRVDVSSQPQLISVNMLIRPSVDLKWVSVPISYPDYNGGVVKLNSANISCIGDLSQSEFNELTLGKLDDIQGTLNNHSERAHQDAENIKNTLQSNANQAHQDADRAHNDAQDIKNSLETQAQSDYDFADNKAKDSQFDAPDFSVLDSFKTVMEGLYNTFLYDGTDCVWTFPAMDIPFTNIHTDAKEINLTQYLTGAWWLNYVKPVVTMLGLLFAGAVCVRTIGQCITLFTNTDTDYIYDGGGLN